MGILSALALILPLATAQIAVYDTTRFVIPNEYTHKASSFGVKLSSPPTGSVTYQVRVKGFGRLSTCELTVMLYLDTHVVSLTPPIGMSFKLCLFNQ
jgi:hypothetical protein